MGISVLSPSNIAVTNNFLHNGAMQVNQRTASVPSITTTGYYTADRWKTENVTQGTWTQSVENDAPVNLRKSLKMLCTTADASPAAGDSVAIYQILEGQYLNGIAKGTNNALSLTLSFWVKSNVTGTYIANLWDSDNTRTVSAAYTISSSGNWEFKTITFPPDTTGAFTNDANASLSVYFYLGAGSNKTSGTLQTAWGSWVAANAAVGQVNVAASTNNYWQITGVQLETGMTASQFQFKSYGQELIECQRYYYLAAQGSGSAVQNPIGVGYQFSSTSVATNVYFPVTMRQAPILDSTTGTDYYVFNRNGGSDTFNSLTLNSVSSTMAQIYNASEISGTAGQAGMLLTYDSKPLARVAFTADL